MFETRWRWNATRSLALLRRRGRQEGPAQPAAHARPGPAGGGVPRPDRLPGQPRRRRHRGARPPAGAARPCATAWSRRSTPRGCAAFLIELHAGRDPAGRARRGRAVAVLARDPERQPLRLPGRRAAGGAALARGLGPARAARRDRREPGRARPRRRWPRWSRRRSPGPRPRRAARPAARPGRPARGRGARPRLGPAARGAGRRPARRPAGCRAGEATAGAGLLGGGRAPLAGRAGLAGRPLRPGRGRAARAASARLRRSRRRRSTELVRARLAISGPDHRGAPGRRCWPSPAPTSRRRSPRSSSRGPPCAGSFVAWPRSPGACSGATAGCWPGSTGAPSTGCAGRSSRSSVSDFIRFLLDWQHVSPGTQLAGPRRAARRRRAAAGLRGRGRRLGAGAAAGPPGRLRSGLAGRAVPGWRGGLGPARVPARGHRRRPAGRRPSRWPCAGICRWLLGDRADADRRRRALSPRAARGARLPARLAAPASSRRSCAAPTACGPRWRTRCGSWWPPAGSPPTASRPCGRCCRRRRGAGRRRRAPALVRALDAQARRPRRGTGPLVAAADARPPRRARRIGIEALARQYVRRYGVVFRDLLRARAARARPGATWCASTAAWRCGASCAAAAWWPASSASSSPRPRRSRRCGPCAAAQERRRRRAVGLRSAEPGRPHHPRAAGPRHPGQHRRLPGRRAGGRERARSAPQPHGGPWPPATVAVGSRLSG